MGKIGIAILVGAAAFALAGCGGDDKKDSSELGRGTVTCEGNATTDPTGLPADFPAIEGVTYTSATKDGPSAVVDGFAEIGMGDLFEEYEDAFKAANYTILFDEQESDDAEISYRTADKATQGLVALRKCDDDDITSVHITNRAS